MADEKATVERGFRLLAWEIAYDGDVPGPDDIDWAASVLGAPEPRRAARISKALQAAYAAGQQSQASRDGWVPVGEALPDSNLLVQFVVSGASFRDRWVGSRGADCGVGHEWQDLTQRDARGEPETYGDAEVTYWAPLLPPPPAPQQEGE